MRNERYIMVVEDEALQGFALANAVENAGFETLGPFADASEALSALDYYVPHAALLDIQLNTETSQQVADALRDLDVPFAFITAHARALGMLIEGHGHRPVISKPVSPTVVIDLLDKLSAESLNAA